MILNTKDLKCGYEGKTIIKSINLSIDKGEFMVLLGPNGSGKSTFLKTISGNLKKMGGKILLYDKERETYKPRNLAKIMSYLPQNPVSPKDLTVKDLVSFGRNPYTDIFHKDIEAEIIRQWAMEETGVDTMKDRLLTTLSGGERQRAWISMCLCQKTDLILLDEPTSSLDIRHQKDVMDSLRRLNKEHGIAVITVLHDINQAIRYADKIAILKKGELKAFGKPEEVMSPEIMKEIYEIDGEFVRFGKDNILHFIPY